MINNTAVRVKGYGHKPWELVERTEGNVYQTDSNYESGDMW